MGTSGLNELELFAKEAADREWMAFLGDTSPLSMGPQEDRGVGEDGLQHMHQLAKAAFVDEVAGHCRTDDEALTWALSLVDEQDLDTQIAKVALALGDVPDAVSDFAFQHAGLDTPGEDFHELAKRAFVEELHDLCGGDVALVKEALALVDDEAFDIAVASEAMGLEKVAFAGLGRALGGVGRRIAGGAIGGVGKGLSGFGKWRAARQGAKADKMISSGASLRSPKIKTTHYDMGVGPARSVVAPGRVEKGYGTYLKDRGNIIKGDLAAERGAGSWSTRLGDKLQAKGQSVAAPKPKTTPPVKDPATTPPVKDPATTPPVKDPATPPVKDPATPPVRDPATPPDSSYGTGKGTWDSMNEWFTNATPLQQMMVGGGGLVGAEAALD